MRLTRRLRRTRWGCLAPIAWIGNRLSVRLVAAAAVSFGVFPVGVALASAGGLDPSFGSGGIAFTAFGETYGFDAVGAIAIQRDGRIVAAGGGGPNSFALARYKDGVLDPGFGHDGKVLTDFDGFGTAGAVAIRPNGKIIAAGSGYGGPAGAQKVDSPWRSTTRTGAWTAALVTTARSSPTSAAGRGTGSPPW
jgi:hypothetical protein